MEEELNEHDLEERLYAMLHHVDETQNNLNQTSTEIDAAQLFENGPRSTVRRYWRTSTDTSPYVKVNTPNPHVRANALSPYVKPNTAKPPVLSNTNKPDNTKPKEEKSSSPISPPDLSIFQSPVPQNVKKVIQIIEHADNQVLLESSDEDEVVEVVLPPKPTITIESSDEDEIHIVKLDSFTTPSKQTPDKSKRVDRAISASPVPSVVSSVSDDFIRGDCIALNISSRQPDNPSFDFSLHGPDLMIQNTPSKKKRKKKNKETVTSTPNAEEKPTNQTEECFATPKTKAKNKKRAKSNIEIQKTVLIPDIYDSDSNQSIIDVTKSKKAYIVTEKSLPSADVYESDSSHSEIVKETNTNPTKEDATGSCTSSGKDKENIVINNDSTLYHTCETVDLTGSDSFITVDNTGINESIVMANVTGFTESQDYGNSESICGTDISKYVSSKVPSILYANLDFDNLKGKETICKKRRYSPTTLRAEMEKFYNESWGGEEFNHREIQKNMSRDKSLWAIDPKDRMPTYVQRKSRCNYCNRLGHRDDTCMRKPAVCYMCGNSGHYESRCPSKICVNCGSPNHMYTNMCRNCSAWGYIRCAECGQPGHPSSHCPDLWRRYHNTIDINMPLERCYQTKHNGQLFCSGCSRRGHLIHTCRTTIPFAALPINSPYVCVYRPIYHPPRIPDQPKQYLNKHSQDSTVSSVTHNRGDAKRASKSPVSHENHANKKRNIFTSDEPKTRQNKGSNNNSQQNTTVKDIEDADKNKECSKNDADTSTSNAEVTEKAPDFIPIGSSNHDNKGQIIQDNEVSDTSKVVTTARIYTTTEVLDKLRTKEGQEWLKDTCKKLDITVQCCGGAFSYLSIVGTVGDQETFQYMLRGRESSKNKDQTTTAPNEVNDSQEAQDPVVQLINKNRQNALRQLTKALDSLKDDIGDPKGIYRELNFLQNRHTQLAKQKVINPKVLKKNRNKINDKHKKLKAILLGQAGLANGADSVSKLYTLKEKITCLRANALSSQLRKEIGEHFQTVFSSDPRDDYSELLKKYYLSTKPAPKKSKSKKKKKPVVPHPQLPKANSIPSEENTPQENTPQKGKQDETVKKAQKNSQMKKLIFFHQRLRKAKPREAINKKKKVELVRKLHTFIASMFQRETLTSKVLKKVKKVQQEAHNFLAANV